MQDSDLIWRLCLCLPLLGAALLLLWLSDATAPF